MKIECSTDGCGHVFDDRNRASLITGLVADTASVEVNTQQESTTTCPECGASIEFGLLILDDDGVWRVSRYAGHADDVTVVPPPGGGVGYEARQTDAARETGAASVEPATTTGLSESELKLRRRALAVIEGDAPDVSPAAKRDAVELALEARVLDDDEVTAARAWRESLPH